MNEKVDVVVIGAGPSGSSAVAEMAESGLDVLMVEKDEFPGKSNVCAGGILKADVEDLDLEPFVIEKEIFGFVCFFPWMVIESRRPIADKICVLRRVFDNYLAQRAVTAGAKLSSLTMAIDVVAEISKVTVYLRKMGTNELIAVTADLVIFADGPSSLAYKSFGLGFSRSPDKTALGAIYELEWKSNPLNWMELYFDRKVSPWGYGWIFPKKHVVNVGVYCLISKLRRNIRRHLDYLVNEHPIASQKLASRKILRFAAALIPLGPAQKTVGHRMLVVGDAAGRVDPLFGAGIGYAIRSGRIAGQITARAFEESDFSSDFLRRYELEWRKTKDSRSIQVQYLKSRALLAMHPVDPESYIRLQGVQMRIIHSKLGKHFLNRFYQQLFLNT